MLSLRECIYLPVNGGMDMDTPEGCMDVCIYEPFDLFILQNSSVRLEQHAYWRANFIFDVCVIFQESSMLMETK